MKEPFAIIHIKSGEKCQAAIDLTNVASLYASRVPRSFTIIQVILSKTIILTIEVPNRGIPY